MGFPTHFPIAKKIKSGYNILSPADYQNVRSCSVLPLPNTTDATPFLLLSPLMLGRKPFYFFSEL